MLRTSLFFDPFATSKLITASALSLFSSLSYAHKVFKQIQHPNLYTWNTLIRAYASSSDPTQSLLIFLEMLYSCPAVSKQILLSCCHQGSFSAQSIEWSRKDVYVWSAMIAGLAMHGCGRAALDLFSRMLEDDVIPNGVTFTNVLCACSHAGLVNEGKYIFNQMESLYGVVAWSKALCMHGDILGTCRLHGSVELAEQACNSLLELDPGNHGAYVLLSICMPKLGNGTVFHILENL
ncbi:Pentatricopeptide repeat [Quillaja saponaria]|uniref:Pentatricopeptide repeat n=1 Tax=Quillaja saponaria TaxID=32244 RepID=A0AAD7KNJ4_QUISA|nr:Pentatricopeptide repeat [Quillaja saponaria]